MKRRRALSFLFTMLATVTFIAQVSANREAAKPVVAAAQSCVFEKAK